MARAELVPRACVATVTFVSSGLGLLQLGKPSSFDHDRCTKALNQGEGLAELVFYSLGSNFLGLHPMFAHSGLSSAGIVFSPINQTCKPLVRKASRDWASPKGSPRPQRRWVGQGREQDREGSQAWRKGTAVFDGPPRCQALGPVSVISSPCGDPSLTDWREGAGGPRLRVSGPSVTGGDWQS